MISERPDSGLDLGRLVESLGFAGSSESLDRKSCCAALYELEPVRYLLGDTLHPGGLALTHRLGKLAGIKRNDLVVDVACGRGASAFAVARSFHCRVVGVDLGLQVVAEAARLATQGGMDGRVSFVGGDGESLPLRDGAFDAALSECSMSLFPDKGRGVAEVARLLRAGGQLGVSDVSVEPGCLPDELTGTLGRMLCLAEAPSVEGYRRLLNAHGLSLIHEQDSSHSVMKLLGDVEAKIAALRLLGSPLGQATGISDLISQALSLIGKVKALVEDGRVGYWLFVSEKAH